MNGNVMTVSPAQARYITVSADQMCLFAARCQDPPQSAMLRLQLDMQLPGSIPALGKMHKSSAMCPQMCRLRASVDHFFTMSCQVDNVNLPFVKAIYLMIDHIYLKGNSGDCYDTFLAGRER